jgi:putative transposase
VSHWVCYYHVAWSTRGRAPILSSDEFAVVEAVVRAAFETERVVVHAVGCMPDHVHVTASIPPALAVAHEVRRRKGSSSHRLNERRRIEGRHDAFGWQAEYGVYTFGRSALPQVISYVANQHDHHHRNDIWPGLERTCTEAPPRPVLSPGGASVP